MFKIYVYVLDTLADWELGYVTSELRAVDISKKMRNVYYLKRLVVRKNQSPPWADSQSYLII